MLAASGNLARRWWLWGCGALVSYLTGIVVFFAALAGHGAAMGWATANALAFVLSCTAISFGFLALFARFARTRNRVWDSLTRNAYGMYLIHYAFVAWLQYALLGAALPALVKGVTVFIAAVGLTWGATAALRRIPAVGRAI